MKTPWINYTKMGQINLKQKNSKNITVPNKKGKGIYLKKNKKNDGKQRVDVKNRRAGNYHYCQIDKHLDCNHNCQDDEFSVSDNVIEVKDSKDIEQVSQIEQVDEPTNDPQIESPKRGRIYSLTNKSLFSTIVKIKDFLHPPIFGGIDQNTIEFIDLNNKQQPQLDTKLVNSTAHYQEEIFGRLIHSTISGSIFLTTTVHACNMNKQDNLYHTFAAPIHDSPDTISAETNNISCPAHHFINIRVPVIVGEYKVEIPLDEDIMFEEEIRGIKGISNEVILKECRLVPTQFYSSLGEGTRKAREGDLFLEGYIQQNIEYSVADKTNGTTIQKEPVMNFYQLHQKIAVELIVHILQIQPVRISCDGTKI
ncbi:BC_2427 family protein [Brevibacillus sp. NPDC058079]|uniref:BC_2427 family protein n=1 Tax=Brevibacillus sp. NPDC058079 TaxID=3346330 RepID=UPI0036E6D44B